jgi:hypothetical protein
MMSGYMTLRDSQIKKSPILIAGLNGMLPINAGGQGCPPHKIEEFIFWSFLIKYPVETRLIASLHCRQHKGYYG